jgi:hypothetical protein
VASRALPSLFVALAFAASMAPRDARAQDTAQLPPVPSMDTEEREGTPRPAAPDDRTGHVYIRAVSGLLLPAGFVRKDAALSDVMIYGLGVGGTLGVGISRYAEMDLTGIYGLFAAPGDCEDCSSDTVAGSLGFTYHLAQGVSLDPWIRLGAGYRTMSMDVTNPGSSTPTPGRYHGVDFLQIGLGATYFPVSSFGFGPYAEADVGTMVSRPSPDPGAPRVYAMFHLGLRFEIDPVRWGESDTPAQPPKKDPAKTAQSDGEAADPEPNPKQVREAGLDRAASPSLPAEPSL